jgi:nucleoside-diphosphate-sugar epimerase
MSRVLVTGAFGNVGQSTVAALLAQGDEVIAFDRDSRTARKLARRFFRSHPDRFTVRLGDIRNATLVDSIINDPESPVDAVCHLAAVIPPRADENPAFAATVNVGGTKAVLDAVETSARRPVLVFASSVATYGDRVEDNFIRTTDPQRPCADDEYAKQKVECEALIRASEARWVILRLSYIVWRKKLALDRLMFRMPPRTSIEVCHTADTGLAFAHATRRLDAVGETLNIGGGERCRTSFRTYLERMMLLFGFGGSEFLPDEAFSREGYHCAFLDTEKAQALLDFQRTTLEDYYAEVAEEARRLSPWVRLCKPIAKAWLKSRSPYLATTRAALKGAIAAATMPRAKAALRKS